MVKKSVQDDEEEMQFDDINSVYLCISFDKFATKPEALRNKLYRLTYSGVSKTTILIRDSGWQLRT